MSRTHLWSRWLLKIAGASFMVGALMALAGCAAAPETLEAVHPHTLVTYPAGNVFDAIDATPWAPDARPESVFTPSAPRRR